MAESDTIDVAHGEVIAASWLQQERIAWLRQENLETSLFLRWLTPLVYFPHWGRLPKKWGMVGSRWLHRGSFILKQQSSQLKFIIKSEIIVLWSCCNHTWWKIQLIECMQQLATKQCISFPFHLQQFCEVQLINLHYSLTSYATWNSTIQSFIMCTWSKRGKVQI